MWCYWCSVAKSCLTIWELMDYSTPGSSVLCYLWEFAQIQIHWVDSIHIILCHPLLLLPSVFPSIRVFKWISCSHQVSKYWSFSFNISLSSEYSELISFRIYWFDLLAVQGTLRREAKVGRCAKSLMPSKTPHELAPPTLFPTMPSLLTMLQQCLLTSLWFLKGSQDASYHRAFALPIHSI